MIQFPAGFTPETFLADYWQKKPLFMPGALDGPKPALTRNELGWLATLDDVESRIVFTERSESGVRYRVETGPFDEQFLMGLPKRGWSLLVHDVEKHLPVFRALFADIPFIPDWRIDDLMVSFAAPGGGVGPHADNYDVFLLQGAGVREWHFTEEQVAPDREASEDLALLKEFVGETRSAEQGDILYLPPGTPHWGTATRACLTYSVGMRAPQLSDLNDELPDNEAINPFYQDPDLSLAEIAPGFISQEAKQRAEQLAGHRLNETSLGRTVTFTKDWLRPEKATAEECDYILKKLSAGETLEVHGMARIAWDDSHIYVNGDAFVISPETGDLIAQICGSRKVSETMLVRTDDDSVVRWMLQHGAFELPETS